MAGLPPDRASAEPGMWTPMSPSDVTNWRKAAYERIGGARRRVFESRGGGHVRGPGGTLERDVVRTVQTTPTRHTGDTAEVEGPRKELGIREARETIDILAADLLEWVQAEPDQYKVRVLHLVKRLRAAGAIDHLTDDEAYEQVGMLAQKVARMNAENAYAKGGFNRPVRVDG